MRNLCAVFINIHTHYPTLLPHTLEIESVYFGQARAPLAERRSVGLHPWFLPETGLENALAWFREQADLPHTLAIGEAGLDKISRTPWALQILAFQHVVEVSEALRKPLIIHCVRAFSEIIALKNTWKPQQPWIFHGFDKKPDTAAMLLRAGCLLSFGSALFRENPALAESLRNTPDTCFFLETDDAQTPIEAVYERAAALRGISLANLSEQMLRNYEQVFG